METVTSVAENSASKTMEKLTHVPRGRLSIPFARQTAVLTTATTFFLHTFPVIDLKAP
jgi:hypothetical protein